MRCFARWISDGAELFRDQTILQFGDSWDLIANIVLLNPGSAKPKSDEIVNDFLISKNLPYIEKPTQNLNYYEFTLDPLMRNLLNCFSKNHKGGVIKIYNLFNLKNSNSNEAIKMLQKIDSKYLFTKNVEFLDRPVIFAAGSAGDEILKKELIKLYNQANNNPKYHLVKISKNEFGFAKVKNAEDIFNSYHPSYTFRYGNGTRCVKLD